MQIPNHQRGAASLFPLSRWRNCGWGTCDVLRFICSLGLKPTQFPSKQESSSYPRPCWDRSWGLWLQLSQSPSLKGVFCQTRTRNQLAKTTLLSGHLGCAGGEEQGDIHVRTALEHPVYRRHSFSSFLPHPSLKISPWVKDALAYAGVHGYGPHHCRLSPSCSHQWQRPWSPFSSLGPASEQ